ncbi:hypothetical protein ACFQDE_04845 [Deinococcus caeni]|uniref:hypothetical protein n=1 Tax=Deinococcus caeni TaxID=569127 RepID=UPI00360D9815
MLAFTLLIVLPAALIALSFRIRPLVPADEGPRDVLGVNLASGGCSAVTVWRPIPAASARKRNPCVST